LAELHSRPTLLSACTSYPILHGKLAKSLSRIVSLEAELKAPIPTSCSSSQLHVVKNLVLAHYVDRLKDENDELRKIMCWLSAHEPQLKMMTEAYKRYDGQPLGANKLGECSCERDEKIGIFLFHHK
jgi:hypothetical protein